MAYMSRPTPCGCDRGLFCMMIIMRACFDRKLRTTVRAREKKKKLMKVKFGAAEWSFWVVCVCVFIVESSLLSWPNMA